MINKWTGIGNLGIDPETFTFENGNKKTSFSLATSRSYKDKQGEKQTETQWHNIVIWGKLCDVVEKYVKKGDKIYLEGEIQYRTYDDKDGNKRYITEIVCSQMTMLGSKSDAIKVQDNLPGNEEDDLLF